MINLRQSKKVLKKVEEPNDYIELEKECDDPLIIREKRVGDFLRVESLGEDEQKLEVNFVLLGIGSFSCPLSIVLDDLIILLVELK